MTKEIMTPKERWQAVMSGEKPDRVPMDYWGTEETTALLIRHLGCSGPREMLEALRVDSLIKLEPRYCGPPLPPDQDVFGCRYRNVDYGRGIYEECVFHPLASFSSVEEIQSTYSWPNPDWWDYSSIRQQASQYETYPLMGGEYEPFLIYRFLRGEEQAYIDMLLNPEMVHFCLDKLLALSQEQITRFYEQIPDQIMFTYVAEDMGGQDDLLFSPPQIREYFLSRMHRIIELIHGSGVFVFHHNDGSIRSILPDLIQIGIDLLNPIQWTCSGMDRRELKQTIGAQVVLHGAMDNQHTLPFGSVKDVQQEVLDNLQILGRDGGYILAPCHKIQSLTPPENVVAMYQSCYKHGRY